MPVDHLNALQELATHFRRRDLGNVVVVSPDLGNAKPATVFARMLGVPVAAAVKERIADDRVVISAIVGAVREKNIIVLEDEIANGGTIAELLLRLREQDVGWVSVACTHGLFTGPAIARLTAPRTGATEIVTTNTVPLLEEKRVQAKITVLSVAPLLAEAIRRIHDGRSVSALFPAARSQAVPEPQTRA